MWKILCLMSTLVAVGVKATPQPEDMQIEALLLAAHLKEMADNGMALRNDRDVELMGTKFKHGFEVGFGDAVQHSRRRRGTDFIALDNDAVADLKDLNRRKRDDSSSESEEEEISLSYSMSTEEEKEEEQK